MNIFLTGSTGFIGSHLMPELLKAGHIVYTNAYEFRDRTYDVIVHLGAKTHIQNIFDPQMIEANIILTHEIFKRKERIVYASSCSAAHFTNPYAMTKMYAEYLGYRHHNSCGLRFHNVYGPGNNKGIVWFLLNQPDGAIIDVRGPQIIRDYVYVSDVVSVIMDNLRYGYYPSVEYGHRGVIEVGTHTGTKTIDLVSTYQELSGKEFKLQVSDHGTNEPLSMVSKKRNCSTILEVGLKMTINIENAKKGIK